MSGEFSTRVVTGLSSVLERRFSRRSFVGRTALVGAAVAVGGLDFVLRPTPAYASVCGSGSTCATGWTAMCCTINDGVNQCPPGSFAGGWWKADAAGLCGGSARYYIDCQGECTHCGCSGSSFCTDSCWNCERHCASGTCDERRVCWNVFRYGQCSQDIGCSGPVLCRMISCVPPWQFADCTTAAATDDNTTDHSAPCLSPWSHLQHVYAVLGGAGSALGATVNGEYAVAGARAQDCVNGRLYSTSAGDFPVYRPRTTAFDAAGGVTALGLPTTDQAHTADGIGIVQTFATGAVFTIAAGGTYAVAGGIYARYRTLGSEQSPLGYVAGNQTPIRNGALEQQFQHGAIVASGYGTFDISGVIYTHWAAAGGQSGGYGFPVALSTGRSQQFERGVISIGPPPRTLTRS